MMQEIGKFVRLVDNEVFGPEIELEPLKGGFGQYIFNSCEKFKDNICQVFVENDTKEDFGSFNERSVKLAVHLIKHGIKKGDNITLCSPNTMDNAVSVTAAVYAGAVFSSLDPSLSIREVNHLLGLVQPKLIFVHPKSIDLIKEYCKNAGVKPHIIVLGESTEYESLSIILKTQSNEDYSKFRPVYIDDLKSPCCMLFSSGTTGLAKGICLSHISLYHASHDYCNASENAKCFFHTSTFYWISGVITYGAQFWNGSCRICVSNFDIEKLPEMIEKYKITNLFLASLFAYKIPHLKSLRNYDLSSIQLIILAGTTISPAQITNVRNALPGAFIYSGYGMSELGNFATFFHWSDKSLADKYPSSVGYPIYNTKIKVVDIETGKKLGPNQPGEFRIKSIGMMIGYHKQDYSNAFDEEGYVKSGDVGTYDENGLFYVHDRIKDMFKYQCWHIVPADIENVINEHPDVTTAVVFGIPYEKDEEIPAAAVILRTGSKTTAKDIEVFVAERVLDRQKLRGGVYIMDKLPLTPSNKVSRKLIKEAIIKQLKK